MRFQVEKDWTTQAGFRAVVIMGDMGSRCGYVGVPKGHPLFGASYSEPHPALAAPPDDEPVGKRGIMSLICSTPETMNSPDMVFDVHGSLTYAGSGDGNYPVKSNLWWFGYDCAHAGDGRSPEYMEMQREHYPNSPIMWHNDGMFRSLDYCVSECESLARQIVERVVTKATEGQP